MTETPMALIDRLEGLHKRATPEQWHLWGERDLIENKIEDLLVIASAEMEVENQDTDTNSVFVCNIGASIAPVMEHSGGLGLANAKCIVALHNAFPSLAEAFRAMERKGNQFDDLMAVIVDLEPKCTDPQEFSGYFTPFNKLTDAVGRAWPVCPGFADSPYELVTQLIGERDELATKLAALEQRERELVEGLTMLLSLHDDPCPQDAATTRGHCRALLSRVPETEVKQ
jgi:hypothetical protein